jgi:hypothetical protein
MASGANRTVFTPGSWTSDGLKVRAQFRKELINRLQNKEIGDENYEEACLIRATAGP